MQVRQFLRCAYATAPINRPLQQMINQRIAEQFADLVVKLLGLFQPRHDHFGIIVPAAVGTGFCQTRLRHGELRPVVEPFLRVNHV